MTGWPDPMLTYLTWNVQPEADTSKTGRGPKPKTRTFPNYPWTFLQKDLKTHRIMTWQPRIEYRHTRSQSPKCTQWKLQQAPPKTQKSSSSLSLLILIDGGSIHRIDPNPFSITNGDPFQIWVLGFGGSGLCKPVLEWFGCSW